MSNPSITAADRSCNRRRPGTRIRRSAVAGALVAALAGAACGGQQAPPVRQGAALHEPLHPDFVLTDTRGRPYDFAAETKGYATMLFFGYTNCPDVCPVHLANLAGALKRLPYQITSRVKVVFVTTDPERDTPERMRAWLDHFNPDFIGLSGTPEEIAAAGRQVKIAPAVKEPSPDGSYLVGHSARVIAFTPDGAGRFIYPFGTRQADWAAEIPALVGWRREPDPQ